jgi:SAM-dependent methyltransferase
MGQYQEIFSSPMYGTFNVVTGIDLGDFKPAMTIDDKTLWLVKLNGLYGWALRWKGSRQLSGIWEIISRQPFLDEMRRGEIDIEVMEPWPPDQVAQWDREHHQFQTFPWGSVKRADSDLIWRTIGDRGEWSGATVLDIGCNFGFHCQQAAKAGAIVTGYDNNPRVIDAARQINDHIEMRDVRFENEVPAWAFDYIFYFSVQHQFDPSYSGITQKVLELAAKARRKVFAEFIIPALVGDVDEIILDALVKGVPLLRYKHKVRRVRKIYEIEGRA